jgi:hypothetical protein
MSEFKTNEIKKLVAERIKEIKGDMPYSKIAAKCNITARISDVSNDKIDCQLSTFIEIATGLRIHPKELFDIVFDFKEYYSELDN